MLALASNTLRYSECMSDSRVRWVLVGIAQGRSPRWDPRQPLSPEVLQGLQGVLGMVCTSEFDKLQCHAASLLVFFRVLRVDKLVVSSKRDG